MFEALADIFEQMIIHARPARAVVGDDPIDFVDTVLTNHGGGGLAPDRLRLVCALARVDESSTSAA
jgi:hypothetical protein